MAGVGAIRPVPELCSCIVDDGSSPCRPDSRLSPDDPLFRGLMDTSVRKDDDPVFLSAEGGLLPAESVLCGPQVALKRLPDAALPRADEPNRESWEKLLMGAVCAARLGPALNTLGPAVSLSLGRTVPFNRRMPENVALSMPFLFFELPASLSDP